MVVPKDFDGALIKLGLGKPYKYGFVKVESLIGLSESYCLIRLLAVIDLS